MTPRTFIYIVKTTDGRRLEVEATSGADAIKLLQIPGDQVRPWYPFPIKALPTDEEKQKTVERLNKLREQKQMKTVLELGEVMSEQIMKAFKGCKGCGRTDPGHNPFNCEVPPMRSEPTPSGEQGIIEQTPARSVPQTGLRPRRPQNEKPLALELPAINEMQGRLF